MVIVKSKFVVKSLFVIPCETDSLKIPLINGDLFQLLVLIGETGSDRCFDTTFKKFQKTPDKLTIT